MIHAIKKVKRNGVDLWHHVKIAPGFIAGSNKAKKEGRGADTKQEGFPPSFLAFPL